MSSAEEKVIYEFEGFQLDVVRRRLVSAGGELVELSSRVFDTLVCLVENRGQLIDKKTLMQTVWPDTVVEENNLNQAITALRKTLGDTRQERRFIATDPGRGYRFVADVITREQDQAPKEKSESIPRLPPKKLVIVTSSVLAVAAIYLILQIAFRFDGPSIFAPAPPDQSIAVLPFADMSPNGDQEYFSDGIAEELTNQLSKLPGLRVAGRTSAFSFKGKNEDLRVIGDKLNVANVLEGSVRKDGGQIRITVTLVNVSDGYHLWTHTYEDRLNDIFEIQDATAKSVANALSIKLGVGAGDLAVGGTQNFDAYDAYLAAGALARKGDREAMLQAIEHLERAVTIDPSYASAWSALAAIYQFTGSFFVPGRTEEFMQKSRMAAAHALEIAPEAVPSLLAKAQMHERNNEWLEAERILRELARQAPLDFIVNMELGRFYQNTGWPSAAIGYFRSAAEIEPLLLLPVQSIISSLGNLGEYDAALEEYVQSKDLFGDHALMHAVATVISFEAGDRVLIEGYLDQLVADDPGPVDTRQFTISMRSFLDTPEQGLSQLRKFYDDPDYALPLMRNAMAVWASYFGDEELALQILKGLYEEKKFLVSAIWRPIHRDMRQLPGFKDLVRELGLVEYWRVTGNWGDFCRPVNAEDFDCN